MPLLSFESRRVKRPIGMPHEHATVSVRVYLPESCILDLKPTTLKTTQLQCNKHPIRLVLHLGCARIERPLEDFCHALLGIFFTDFLDQQVLPFERR